ncbi:ectoine/hydroxyectoine ABC transporter permease subunit EhuC [Pseudomonas gingeri NCPPB 3146 = LMG 5327]|uniref:Ectoine/hydroxyectoine ABC transporter permease subunit EhuC n=4 Tax=Pseudomonas gingeri TaxID=117681 RepID=A0A7Y7Y6I3_9PSED|nr:MULTISPECIES: ectoine/hydroxyectoine ABC transporter permease subunit EhuC [Pseudomonas]NVZ27763.1 ectoine/hydroxyectoine ABC transporter permease subunit EhuC [Pseudomonas gingeri]NVZ64202.1 ectoine/hydroxyectoine ABC transporter permease subunit EhuC [Pseudomonas gingeri]NVZ74925.1 ectoine/hydroxyectoine ABC transporter permease subunit EhuC [Pseudomonas gingeri]NWA05755.1 ectoine/hydroxyectoine ABC transporter permease subunit EhuC [Pseudomonas gingeri]NWC17587.1 ectoine/hydroxyectoine A
MPIDTPAVDTALFIARQLAHGAWVTLQITFLAEVLVLVLSLVIALMRLSPWRALRWFATAYVELLRGISALVLLFYLFFILPLFGISLSPMTTGVIGLGLTFSAYGSEIVRAALVNVSAGQRDALRALDFGPLAALRRIILPQALPFMLPPLGNQLVELMKTTSLVSLITLSDLTFAGNQLVTTLGQQTLIWSIVLVCYFVMAWPLTWLVRRYEQHSSAWRRLSK